MGKDADLPVYFGDAGSSAILHSVGAKHARCAVITLDSPGANYRTVWALHKHYPKVKIYVRAHDVTHGITLEKVLSHSFHCMPTGTLRSQVTNLHAWGVLGLPYIMNVMFQRNMCETIAIGYRMKLRCMCFQQFCIASLLCYAPQFPLLKRRAVRNYHKVLGVSCMEFDWIGATTGWSDSCGARDAGAKFAAGICGAESAQHAGR